MQTLLMALLGAQGVVALVIHDMLSFIQLIGKEIWVENFCRKYFPKFKYNENLVFNSFKMIFFTLFLLGHVGTDFLLFTLWPVQALAILAVLLAGGIVIKLGIRIRKEERKLTNVKDEQKEIKNKVGDKEQA